MPKNGLVFPGLTPRSPYSFYFANDNDIAMA